MRISMYMHVICVSALSHVRIHLTPCIHVTPVFVRGALSLRVSRVLPVLGLFVWLTRALSVHLPLSLSFLFRSLALEIPLSIPGSPTPLPPPSPSPSLLVRLCVSSACVPPLAHAYPFSNYFYYHF